MRLTVFITIKQSYIGLDNSIRIDSSLQ